MRTRIFTEKRKVVVWGLGVEGTDVHCFASKTTAHSVNSAMEPFPCFIVGEK